MGRNWVEGETFMIRVNDYRSHPGVITGNLMSSVPTHDFTFATLNVRNLGREKPNSDFNFSYLKQLVHDATGLTEI